MNPNDPNVYLLERAAEQLGDALIQQLVFVGGAVAGVLITDPAMPDIRPTQDVNVICRGDRQSSLFSWSARTEPRIASRLSQGQTLPLSGGQYFCKYGHLIGARPLQWVVVWAMQVHCSIPRDETTELTKKTKDFVWHQPMK